MSPQPLLSIIVPTLNEASTLPDTLEPLCQQPDTELLVIDGGSTDRTIEIARHYTDTVLLCTPGRARQMNEGASRARGELLLFLHADTVLAPSSLHVVRVVMQDPEIVAGAFQLRIDSTHRMLRFIEWTANIRSRYFGLPYGDQALFVRRADFQAINGFAPWPIMEDVDLVRRLRTRGRFLLLPESVRTSARRWEREGVVWTTIRNGLLLSGFWVGISPGRLVKWYRPVR